MTADAFGFEPFGDEPFDDIEEALKKYLRPAGRTVTMLMSWNKEGDLPAIRIQRIGGGEDDTDDNPRVSIQCFDRPTTENPRASKRVAADVIRRMRGISGVVIDGTCLDDAHKDSGPITRPWDDPDIRVSEIIYSVTVRI